MAPGMAFTNDKLARTLSQQPGLEPEQSWGPITLYRNREALPHIFPVQQVALMAGGLDGLVTLTYSDQENLANTGVVFLSQLSPSEIRSLGQLSSSKFIIQEGYLPELALSLAEGRHSIDPVLYTSVTNPDEGWTPYEWGWYHWQTLTSLKRVAFTLAPASLSMPVSVDGGVYEAFVRAYYSARASALTLSVDGRGIGEAMTAVGDEVGFRWVGLGEIELEAGNHTLRLDSNAGENFVSNIVLVEKGAFRKAQQEAQQLAEGKRVLILSEPSLETPLEASWRKDAKELVIQALTQPQLTPRDLPFGAGLQDDILTLDVTFRHAASKEESLYLYSQIDGLDLRAATVLTLWVGVDSPSRQEIDIKAFLDTDEDGKHDVILRSRENGDWLATLRGRLPTEVEKLSFNLLEAARTLAPNRPSYRVVGLEIGFAKVGDMTGPRAGNYGFRVKSVQLEGPMAEAAVIPEKEMSPPALEGTGWRLDGEELATLAEKSPYPAPGGPYVSPEGLTYQVRKQEGLAILSFQFTRPANVVESLATLVTAPSVDLTRTPYLSLQAKVDKPQNQEIILRFFLDTNGDGKQDVTVRSYEWPEIANKLSGGLPTRFQRLDVNVLKMAQDSAPGKPSYLLVAFEIEYRKRGNTTGSQGGEYKFSVRDLGLVGSLPKEIRGEPWYSEDVGVSASQGTALVAAAPASPHTLTMDVPQPGEYVLSIRAKADSAGGGLGVRVGSERFQVFPGRDFGWHIAGPIWLSEGLARLSVEPQGTGKVYLDQLSLATRQGEGEKDRDAVVQATSKRLHYTKYEIDVKAEQPFFLVFAEAYDPGWRLRLEDGTTLRNYPAYSFGNLYLVERTGAFEMTLEFDRQRTYTLVQRVSFASVAVLLFLLVLPRVVWNWLWRRCHLFRSH
jgi:hypothetical protein